MPVMNGLQATRIIRSFEETGNWDAAAEAGIEHQSTASDSSTNGQELKLSTKRIPIVAVSVSSLMAPQFQFLGSSILAIVSLFFAFFD